MLLPHAQTLAQARSYLAALADQASTIDASSAYEHVLIEQTYVLEGTLVCGEGECKAGDYVWRPAGSRHEAWAGPQGGLMLAMFQVPNKFFERDGRITDISGADWEGLWGGVVEE